MSKIREILKFAMRMEKDAQDFYTFYADKAESPETRKLFAELAEIEKGHSEILRVKFEEMGLQDPPVSISWVVDDNFAAKDPHILADSSDAVRADGSSDLAIIRMAYLIENDFAEFYKHAVANVEDADAKNFLSTLSEWENKHRDMFYDRYQVLLKKHWGEVANIIFNQ